jgi:hypothetical protein
MRHVDHVATSNRKKLELNSPTSGGRSVGIVRSPTEGREFMFLFVNHYADTRCVVLQLPSTVAIQPGTSG